MIFFKQYLITLTCIVISVSVISVAIEPDFKKLNSKD